MALLPLSLICPVPSSSPVHSIDGLQTTDITSQISFSPTKRNATGIITCNQKERSEGQTTLLPSAKDRSAHETLQAGTFTFSCLGDSGVSRVFITKASSANSSLFFIKNHYLYFPEIFVSTNPPSSLNALYPKFTLPDTPFEQFMAPAPGP